MESRVRNAHSKWFTFAGKHSSDSTKRRLEYMFISNALQKLVIITQMPTPTSTVFSIITKYIN